MTNRIYLALKYKDAQIIKHALQEYVKRSDVKNETDIEEESILLNNIEKEVNLFKMKNGIGQEKSKCIDI
jgi:hypothetical protein|nr:MAG TPA: hypothetical protein [Caudoviricetes sp.]